MIGAALRHHEAEVHVLVKVECAGPVDVDCLEGVLKPRENVEPLVVGRRGRDAHGDLCVVDVVVVVAIKGLEVGLKDLEGVTQGLPQGALLPPPCPEARVPPHRGLVREGALDRVARELARHDVEHVHEARERQLVPHPHLRGVHLVDHVLVDTRGDCVGHLLTKERIQLADAKLAGPVGVVLHHGLLHDVEGGLDEVRVGGVPEEDREVALVAGE
mmetsp:Transcript_43427/g.106242  ORF Transcript_43427/g.106242 Transcript_43427/m.106242 type:complete len:216 (+) Transcript_43427:1613-2260(+)